MKIYTKGGDLGQTSLLGGARVYKSETRLDAYGTVDELNSHVGLVRAMYGSDGSAPAELIGIQSTLFSLGSHLATQPSKEGKVKVPDLHPEDITLLENAIDKMEGELPPLANFILPGGSAHEAQCHVARTVCRRAERIVVALTQHEGVEEGVLAYINRLSDYLFVLARYVAMKAGAEETPWIPNPRKEA